LSFVHVESKGPIPCYKKSPFGKKFDFLIRKIPGRTEEHAGREKQGGDKQEKKSRHRAEEFPRKGIQAALKFHVGQNFD
jgi:hypothetical protein